MRVMSNGRVHRSQAEWAEVLNRCSSSGLSPEAFCQREQIHLGSFQRWQRKIGDSSPRSVSETPHGARRGVTDVPRAHAGFV